ncbi:pentatricopeptide repeat-containing protein [Quercus suber]|uniref:Pentatricopeptide repeat-containing protein n=1 Tax=Quercus suber TaxID=58331 RepID=A0AAW0L4M9_QUESU
MQDMRSLDKVLITYSRHICTLSTPNLNFMINTYFQQNCINHARKLFDQNPSSRTVVSWNTMINGYVKNHQMQHAHDLFDEMPMKDVVSWNTMLSGFHKTKNPEALYLCLVQMRRAQGVFDAMPERNIVSWTGLVNGYICNKRINEARSVFNKMSERNVFSWTVMISGYVQNQKFMDALELFIWMLKSGCQPNHFTFSSVLDACAGCSSLIMGQQVHSSILKSGVPSDDILSTSVVDMYAKCGDIEAAFSFFESMPNKNLVSWNSIIGGFARHGLAIRALEEFERMIKFGVRPDEITFVNVLSACGHGGLIAEGEKYFNSMVEYTIKAGVEHYACMVDLYGRAGKLEKAEKFIKEMPFEPDVVVWGALLGACGLHSSLELGQVAAERICKLKNDHPAVYSMLSKIQGEKEEWSSVIEFREMMKERHVKKQKASSWVESPFGDR